MQLRDQTEGEFEASRGQRKEVCGSGTRPRVSFRPAGGRGKS